jgi:hypothetical protein
MNECVECAYHLEIATEQETITQIVSRPGPVSSDSIKSVIRAAKVEHDGGAKVTIVRKVPKYQTFIPIHYPAPRPVTRTAEVVVVEDSVEATDKKKLLFFIEVLCRPADRDGLIGDLTEKYNEIRDIYGERRAETWFRAQVFWTCSSLLAGRFSALPGMPVVYFIAGWVVKKLSGN